MDYENPFALSRASDYTIDQINSLWVEMGDKVVNAIIEPRSLQSKYILGGKGTGKTHLLRYFSYPAAKNRHPDLSGFDVLKRQGFFAVFLRATGLDASRFELSSTPSAIWQQVFAAYLELRLVEMVLDAMTDIRATSPQTWFDDQAFLHVIGDGVNDEAFHRCSTLASFRDWVGVTRRNLDNATNNAAFTGELKAAPSFSIGALALKIGGALGSWHSELKGLPLLYLLDEIENFNASQQQVVNSLIRYGEGTATFRVTGRLYAIRTLSTLGNGEANREGAEFKKTILDEIVAQFKSYPDFAKRFIVKRLTTSTALPLGGRSHSGKINPTNFFTEIDSSDFYANYLDKQGIVPESSYLKRYFDALTSSDCSAVEAKQIIHKLVDGFPLLIGKLNLLLFAKKLKNEDSIDFASKIRTVSHGFVSGNQGRNFYSTAYGHYAGDLFAQLCRDAKTSTGVPYAGFSDFVKMSSGSPRNLLIILGRIYEIATFKGIVFSEEEPISIAMQTEGVGEAARFMFDSDANYGSPSDRARVSVSRLASVLRTARFALNIPNHAPLSVSFESENLAEAAVETLHSALNYSLVFEIADGRPDRNSQRVLRKIYLNPMLSARWDLPIGRRGDLSLNTELANAIFDIDRKDEFEYLLRNLETRWNSPFNSKSKSSNPLKPDQSELF
jgi:hypothetical protein